MRHDSKPQFLSRTFKNRHHVSSLLECTTFFPVLDYPIQGKSIYQEAVQASVHVAVWYATVYDLDYCKCLNDNVECSSSHLETVFITFKEFSSELGDYLFNARVHSKELAQYYMMSILFFQCTQ